MKKRILLFLIAGLTCFSMSAFADSGTESSALPSINEKPQAAPKKVSAPKPVALPQPGQDLVSMESSQLKNRIDQLERRVSNMERDFQFLEDRVRTLDRTVEDLRRTRR